MNIDADVDVCVDRKVALGPDQADKTDIWSAGSTD